MPLQRPFTTKELANPELQWWLSPELPWWLNQASKVNLNTLPWVLILMLSNRWLKVKSLCSQEWSVNQLWCSSQWFNQECNNLWSNQECSQTCSSRWCSQDIRQLARSIIWEVCRQWATKFQMIWWGIAPIWWSARQFKSQLEAQERKSEWKLKKKSNQIHSYDKLKI